MPNMGAEYYSNIEFENSRLNLFSTSFSDKIIFEFLLLLIF